MELKVWVEGIQRIVCGVTEITTCQDVVYALAHATGKTGRFTLMERWRNSERLLAPHEHPLKVLLKWGEYSSDVQFILHRTALDTKSSQSTLTHQRTMPQLMPGVSLQMPPKGAPPDVAYRSSPQLPAQSKDIKKSLTFSGVHAPHLQSSGESANSSPVGGPEVCTYPQSYNPKVPPSPIYHHPYPNDAGGLQQRHNLPNSSLRPHYINRPPAPPPYEFVRGNPPPPPGTSASLRYSNAPPFNVFGGSYPSSNDRNPVRPVSSFPPHSMSSKIPHAPNAVARPPPRELPPYRDPPPPPLPSHPTLVKMSSSSKVASPKQLYPSSLSQERSQQQVGPVDSENKYSSSGAQKVSNAVIVPLSTSLRNSSADSSSVQHGSSTATAVQLPKNPSVSSHPPASCVASESKNSFYSQNACVSLSKVRKYETAELKDKYETNHHPRLYSETDEHLQRTSREPLIYSSNNTTQHEVNHSSSSSTSKNQKETDERRDPGVQNLVKQEERREPGVQNLFKQFIRKSPSKDYGSSLHHNNNNHSTEEVIVDAYYKEIVKLVNEQREKITAQQIDLTKYEAEISFLEGHWKEEESCLNYLKEEVHRLELLPVEDDGDSSAKLLAELEEQFKAAKKSEAATVEEISSLKKKINSVDIQVSQMDGRVRSIQEALEREICSQKQKREEERENFQAEEQDAILREIDKLQSSVENATKQLQETQESAQQLTQEMTETETRLEEKRKEIERLKQAMRDVNLEALSMVPPEEGTGFAEGRTGSVKTGSNRRIVGSPRQLETAVPTSKNPHGVWV